MRGRIKRGRGGRIGEERLGRGAVGGDKVVEVRNLTVEVYGTEKEAAVNLADVLEMDLEYLLDSCK